MVKGVNKTIIEINNTESEYFDRILLFVKASHNGDTDKLDREVAKISRSISNDVYRVPLRKAERARKRKIIFIAVGAILALAVAAVIIL